MKLTVEISMDGAVFMDNAVPEIKRLLSKVAEGVEDNAHYPDAFRVLVDVNGNTVGFWEVRGE